MSARDDYPALVELIDLPDWVGDPASVAAIIALDEIDCLRAKRERCQAVIDAAVAWADGWCGPNDGNWDVLNSALLDAAHALKNPDQPVRGVDR